MIPDDDTRLESLISRLNFNLSEELNELNEASQDERAAGQQNVQAASC